MKQAVENLYHIHSPSKTMCIFYNLKLLDLEPNFKKALV